MDTNDGLDLEFFPTQDNDKRADSVPQDDYQHQSNTNINNNRSNSNDNSSRNTSKSKYTLMLENFLANVQKKASIVEFKQRLSQCEEDCDRIHVVSEHFKWTPSHPLIISNYRKNGETSSDFRNDGNLAYGRGLFVEAVRSYNLALLFAVPGQPELGLAYANRSAALHYLGYTEEALGDIELALENQYPTDHPDKLQKLHQRKERYQMHLKEREFCEAEEVLRKEIDKRNLFCKKLFSLKPPNPLAPSLHDSVEIRFNSERGRHIVAKTDIPAGTTVMVEAPFVAVLDNSLDFDVDHCHHCLKKTVTCIPCPTCIFAVYCNEKCRKEAEAQYHRYECPCLPELHCLLKDDRLLKHFYLVFKLICILGPCNLFSIFSTQNHTNLFPQHKKSTMIPGSDPETGIYTPDSYNAVYNLKVLTDKGKRQDESNHDQEKSIEENNGNPKRNFDPNSNSSTSAKNENDDCNLVLILMCLILSQTLAFHSSFFQEIPTPTPIPNKFPDFVAQLILHHFKNFQRHIFELHEFAGKESGGLISLRSYMNNTLGKSFPIPTNGPNLNLNPKPNPNPNFEFLFNYNGFSIGIFTTLSLFNHSCDPSVTRFTGKSKGKTAVVTLRRVREGEELLLSYGPVYHSCPTENGRINSKTRQKTLIAGYHFQCSCIACRNNWPSDTSLIHNADCDRADFSCSYCSLRFSHESKMSAEFIRCRLSQDIINYDLNEFRFKTCGVCDRTFASRDLEDEFNEHRHVLERSRKLILKNSPLQIIPSLKDSLEYFGRAVCPPNYNCIMASQFFREAVDLIILFSEVEL